MTRDVRVQAPACSSVMWRLSLILVKPTLDIRRVKKWTCSVAVIFGEIPGRDPTKSVDEKVDHHGHLGAEVSTDRVDGEDVNVSHAVSPQERQKRSLPQIRADHESRQLDDALAG
jgi:hypothetical protein